MTHLYIELNTGLTEEVDDKTIEKLYNTVTENTLDGTSDLKGRLHTPSARDIHVSYLTTHFPELYISADVQYITLADPDLESFLADYIGNGETIVLGDIQLFILSGKKFGESYYNPNVGGVTTWILIFSNLQLVDTFNEFGTLFNGLTKINQNAFKDFRSLSSITIPSTVTEIGSSAFYNAWALTSLNLENILSIGGNAFENSNIEGNISLPNLTYLGGGSFSHTKITSISLPADTILQGDATFSQCNNLTQVTGLSTNTNLRASTFNSCSNLETIDIDFSIVTNIGNNVFESCQKLNLGNLVLPSLTSLGSWTFGSCPKLYSVDLSSSSITKLYNGVFSGCSNLTTVILPSSCTKFDGREIFLNCSSLTSVNTGNITEFNNTTFSNCTSLLSVDLSSATHLGDRCFSYSGLTSIDLSNVTALGVMTFWGCTNLQTISNTSSVSELDYGCFHDCTLLTSLDLSGLDFTKEKTIHAFITDRGLKLFGNCENLTTIGINTIPITELGTGVFMNCKKLSGSLLFPNVTTLNPGSYGCLFLNCLQLTKLSFGHITSWGMPTNANESRGIATGCTNLKILDFGDSITTIYTNNCVNCSNLAAVLINTSTVPSYGGTDSDKLEQLIWRLFGNSNVNVYVPDAAVNDYKAASGWSSFASNILPMSLYNESAILAS